MGGRETERERERNIDEWEISVSCLSHAPNPGPGLQLRHVLWLVIKVGTFPRMMPNPLSHTSQGPKFLLFCHLNVPWVSLLLHFSVFKVLAKVQATTVSWLDDRDSLLIGLLTLASPSFHLFCTQPPDLNFSYDRNPVSWLSCFKLWAFNSMALKMNLKLYETLERTLHDMAPFYLQSPLLIPALSSHLFCSLTELFTSHKEARGHSPVLLLPCHSLCSECPFLLTPSYYTLFRTQLPWWQLLCLSLPLHCQHSTQCLTCGGLSIQRS